MEEVKELRFTNFRPVIHWRADRFAHYGLWYEGEEDDDLMGYPLLLQMTREMAGTLFQGMTVFTTSSYNLKKAPRKRWFLPDKPAVFRENSFIQGLEEKIASGQRDYAHCIVEGWQYSALHRRRGYYAKRFFMSSPVYSDTFFEDCLEEEDFMGRHLDEPIFFLGGYQPEQARNFASIEDMADDIRGDNHIALILWGDAIHGDIKFEINPYRYSVRALVELVEETVKRHNLKLEVDI